VNKPKLRWELDEGDTYVQYDIEGQADLDSWSTVFWFGRLIIYVIAIVYAFYWVWWG